MESMNYTPHAISDLLSAISDLLSGYDGSCHCEDLAPTCDPASSEFRELRRQFQQNGIARITLYRIWNLVFAPLFSGRICAFAQVCSGLLGRSQSGDHHISRASMMPDLMAMGSFTFSGLCM